ncbi:MAG: UvrD-helicase domain-containing protein [Bacteroidota bacterium]
MSFLVYRSSAGSGKTFSLVLEYLGVALSSDDPLRFRNILGMTFTNKAADEMKSRILYYLHVLSEPELNKGLQKKLFEILCEKTGVNDTVISKRANDVLTSILHNYSDFSVNTIDSFIHGILRTFAPDLHLPGNFEVEMDTESLFNRAVDDVLSKAGVDRALTDYLVEFSEHRMDEEQSLRIESDLLQFGMRLLDEKSFGKFEHIRDIDLETYKELRKKLTQYINDVKIAICKPAAEAMKLISTQGLTSSHFYHKDSGIHGYFRKTEFFDDDVYLKSNSYVVDTIEKGKLKSSVCSKEDEHKILEIAPTLTNFYFEIKRIEKEENQYTLACLLQSKLYELAVLGEIDKALSEIKQQESILPVSEFNRRVSEVVLNEPVPFIYERAGLRYKNFLLDEFQDTSVLQWQNLLPLVEESLSNGNMSMVVGDGKQSIYRWRNGEVDQFVFLPQIFEPLTPLIAAKEDILIRNYKEEVRSENYRSRKEIVEFNNRFFEYIKNELENFDSIYNKHEQTYTPEHSGGYVKAHFISKDNYEEQTFCEILNAIRNSEKNNYSLSDIAILCRTRKQASMITEFLANENIEVISSESMLVAASSNVNALTAFLKFLTGTHDSITRTVILKFLCSNSSSTFDQNKLEDLFKNKALKFSKEDFEKTIQGLGFLTDTNLLQSLPVYDVLTQLIETLKMNRYGDAYINFFLDAAHQFSMREGSNIRDFLSWWEKKLSSTSVVVPSGINAVTVMTIHKAKGLEFPIVIHPFADKAFDNKQNLMWVKLDKENYNPLSAALIPAGLKAESTRFGDEVKKEKWKKYLDEVNVTYVALTRPTDCLYIFSSIPDSEKKSIGFFLYNFLNTDSSERKNIFEFGNSNHNNENKKTILSNSYTLDKFNLSDWRKTISLRCRHSETSTKAGDHARLKGILIHRILSEIESNKNISDKIQKLKCEGLCEESLSTEIEKEIELLVNNPVVSKYFNEEYLVFNEIEIIDPSGKAYRPDRMLMKGKEVIVLEFKTGKPDKKHSEQILNYSKLLAECGFTVIEKKIIYTDVCSVIAV